ncbi:MAG: hypothetical protein HY429_02355 [Candidatus Levybacteria bacterium]|nr:hypothetical protein [Candidatus Levybacteria bacterium]
MAANTIYKVLIVNIKSPEEIFFQGEADAISSVNEAGNFDVLPLHTNFISLIQKTLVIYQQGQKLKEMQIEAGIIKVTNNNVNIFLGIESFSQPTPSPKT